MSKSLYRPVVTYSVNWRKRNFPDLWNTELVVKEIKDPIEWIIFGRSPFDCIGRGFRFVKDYVPQYSLWGIPDGYFLYSTNVSFVEEKNLSIKYLAGHMDSKEFIEYVKQSIYEGIYGNQISKE